MTNVKIVNLSTNPLPKYETEGSAGMDVRAYLDSPLVLKPFERVAVPTGLFMEMPVGILGELRPRSGLSLKNGITIANEWLIKKLGHNVVSAEDEEYIVNFPPTVDPDYRGEVKVPLINLSDKEYIIDNGDRIAQLVFVKYENVNFTEVSISEMPNIESLSDTERGSGAFGHSGKK